MNENKIVESQQKIVAVDHRAIATIACFCIAIACFLLTILGALTSPKVACITLLVLMALAGVVWAVSKGHMRYLHHAAAKQTHSHITAQLEIARIAALRGDSVELKHTDHLGRIHELRTISPLTIPNAPVTVKELNWGMPQIAAPLTLPDKTLAIDIMRKWALTPQNLFLALGKGGKEWACTLEGLMHVAHDAPTGAGKTAQWKAEIIQLLKLGIQVILCNPHFAPMDKKGNDWRPIGQAIEQQGPIELDSGVRIPALIRKYENIVSMLKWLALREIDRRFNLQAQGNYSYTPLYIFLDEWPSVVNRFPIAGDYLVDVLQRGRAVDVCVDANAQGFLQNDVDLKGSARENFQTAYHMGGSVYSGAKLLDMPVKDMNALLKQEQVALGQGIAMLRNNESVPQAELVRLPYADNNYVYYMLGKADNWILPEFRDRNVSGNVRNQPEIRNISDDFRNGLKSDNKPDYGNLSEISIDGSIERSMSIEPEIRNQIIELRGQGLNRTEIRDEMHFSGEKFKIIKHVLDEEGL
jgi:hypothetical protein